MLSEVQVNKTGYKTRGLPMERRPPLRARRFLSGPAHTPMLGTTVQALGSLDCSFVVDIFVGRSIFVFFFRKTEFEESLFRWKIQTHHYYCTNMSHQYVARESAGTVMQLYIHTFSFFSPK